MIFFLFSHSHYYYNLTVFNYTLAVTPGHGMLYMLASSGSPGWSVSWGLGNSTTEYVGSIVGCSL